MKPVVWADSAQHIDSLIAAALSAAHPARAVQNHLSLTRQTLRVGNRQVDLDPMARIYLVGAGKAAAGMAGAAANILGKRLTAGVVAVPQMAAIYEDSPIEWIQAGHPLPDHGSLRAGAAIERLLRETHARDVVLALISGGGSAMLELPRSGLTLDDLRHTTTALLRSGASVNDLNTVRIRLSKVKGGGLVRMAWPATTFSLIVSDVVGDRLEFIASGPTRLTTGTPDSALEVIDRYKLAGALTEPVMRAVSREDRGVSDRGSEPINVIVSSNRTAAAAACARAQALGFNALVLTTWLQGEARQAGVFVAGLAKSLIQHATPFAPPACLVLGGETTVTVTGDGTGGRNQELALAAAIELDGWERCAVASFGTDGIDGPTDSAGARVTGETARRAREKGLSPADHLDRNDSHSLLAAIGADLRTGLTGTNVNDLVFVLAYAQ